MTSTDPTLFILSSLYPITSYPILSHVILSISCQVYKFDMNMRPVAQNGSELPLSGEFLEKKVISSLFCSLLFSSFLMFSTQLWLSTLLFLTFIFYFLCCFDFKESFTEGCELHL